MYAYHEAILELGLKEDPKLRKLFNAGLDESIRKLTLEVDALAHHSKINPRVALNNGFKESIATLEAAIAIIEGQKCLTN